MKNEVYLAGNLTNIEPSHTYDGTQYFKAVLCVADTTNKVPIIFKDTDVKDNQVISIFGTLRSHTDNQNTDLYVYTDFTIQEDTNDCVFLEGNICSISNLKTDRTGRTFRTFVLGNNQIFNNRKINNYIPCIIYEGYDKLSVKDSILLRGVLVSKGKWCEVLVDEFSIFDTNNGNG